MIRLGWKPVLGAAALGLLVGIGVGVAQVRERPEEPRAGRPCHVPGVSDRALCHSIVVPEDWAEPDGRKIRLHVAVLPSRGPAVGGSALFVLAGGPGQAAGKYGDLVDNYLDRVRETRPIILMDARGTGRSGGMDCAELAAEDAAYDTANLRPQLEACRRRWGVQALQHYGTPEVVQDVEAVRQRLGFKRLDLWGGSWGTRTALLYMRAFPGSVRSAVLDGVAAPNSQPLLTESRYAQAALDALLADCARDAGCNGAFPQLKPRLQAWLDDPSPTRALTRLDPATGERTTVQVPRDVVAQLIRGGLYSADGSAMLPFALDRLTKGDATALWTLARAAAAVGRNTMFIGASLSAMCTEELARTPREQVVRASAGAFSRTGFYDVFAEGCRGWPIKGLPPGYAQPVASDAPVLLLSGGLDPITPPASAEVALRHLTNARHVVAPKTGHNVTTAPCADRVIAAFVRDPEDELDAACLTRQVRPPFMVDAMGPRP